ncbi:MAG: hypothetical protein HQL73_13510, partial [Magnetococcales bacterium]|nr:hypothetical protein [Magnetococcales bacterium]
LFEELANDVDINPIKRSAMLVEVGNLWISLHQSLRAIDAYRRAFTWEEENELFEYEHSGTSLVRLAETYLDLGEFGNFQRTWQQAIAVFRSRSDDGNLALAYALEAKAYMRLAGILAAGESDEMKKRFVHSLQVLPSGDRLTAILEQLNKPDPSKDNGSILRDLQALGERSRSPLEQASIDVLVGMAFMEQKRQPEAMDHQFWNNILNPFARALMIFQKENNFLETAFVFKNIASMYFTRELHNIIDENKIISKKNAEYMDNKQFERARISCYHAMETINKIYLYSPEAQAQALLGIYLNLAMVNVGEKKFLNAFEWAMRAKELAKKSEDKKIVQDVLAKLNQLRVRGVF